MAGEFASTYVREKFEDTKGVIIIRRSKNDRQHKSQIKILHRTSNTNPTKTGMNSGAPDGKAVPVPLVTPVALL